jgi:hypothetical protein
MTVTVRVTGLVRSGSLHPAVPAGPAAFLDEPAARQPGARR